MKRRTRCFLRTWPYWLGSGDGTTCPFLAEDGHGPDPPGTMRSVTWTAPEYPRTDEPFTGPERPMLDGFLDWYRASLLRRCTGLTGEQLS